MIEPGAPFVDNWHVGAIAEHLDACKRREIRKLIVNIPPRNSKSTLVSQLFPTYVWASEPSERILTTSYAATLSMRDALASRRVIESEWYQERWGHVFTLMSDQNQKQRYENSERGFRVATSFGGSATGDGGNYRIIDDPHKASDVHSETVREGEINWLKETWSTRQQDPKSDVDIVVMQRLHERDATGYLLAEVGGYEHLCLPAEYDPKRRCVTSIGFRDPRTEPGELLNPHRFGEGEIAELKLKLGPYGAAGQLDQNPAPSDGGMVKRTWWRFWSPPGVTLPPVPLSSGPGGTLYGVCEPLPARLEREILSGDFGMSGGVDNDFTALGHWGAKAANRYLLDQRLGQWDINAQLSELDALVKAAPKAREKYIENKANGPAVMGLRKGKIAGLLAVDPKHDLGGDKAVRLNKVIPEIAAGNVYLPHPSIAPWVWDFIAEFALFPNGKHDDQIDQATQALIKLQTRATPGSTDKPGGF